MPIDAVVADFISGAAETLSLLPRRIIGMWWKGRARCCIRPIHSGAANQPVGTVYRCVIEHIEAGRDTIAHRAGPTQRRAPPSGRRPFAQRP
jgi:hypothetical protein